jgi:hypothetical protein
MAITRTQRSELFRRVVFDRPPIAAPVGFVREEIEVAPAIEPPVTARPRTTLSYLERVLMTSRRVLD